MTANVQTPFTELIPQFRQMAQQAGRDPASLSISIWGRQPDYDEISGYGELGVERVCTSLESQKQDDILPLLDRWATLIARINA